MRWRRPAAEGQPFPSPLPAAQACKFTGPRGEVSVEITSTRLPRSRRVSLAGALRSADAAAGANSGDEDEGDEVAVAHEVVRVAVRDTGVGIPEGKIGLLFRPFSQIASARGAKAAGTGLGLVIAKMLSEKMGGWITVSSTEGKGSVFTVTLPLEVAAGPPRRRSSIQGAPDYTSAGVGGATSAAATLVPVSAAAAAAATTSSAQHVAAAQGGLPPPPLPLAVVAVSSERLRAVLLQMLDCIRGQQGSATSSAVSALPPPPLSVRVPGEGLGPGAFRQELARTLSAAAAAAEAGGDAEAAGRAAAAAAALTNPGGSNSWRAAGRGSSSSAKGAGGADRECVVITDCETFLRLAAAVRRHHRRLSPFASAAAPPPPQSRSYPRFFHCGAAQGASFPAPGHRTLVVGTHARRTDIRAAAPDFPVEARAPFESGQPRTSSSGSRLLLLALFLHRIASPRWRVSWLTRGRGDCATHESQDGYVDTPLKAQSLLEFLLNFSRSQQHHQEQPKRIQNSIAAATEPAQQAPSAPPTSAAGGAQGGGGGGGAAAVVQGGCPAPAAGAGGGAGGSVASSVLQHLRILVVRCALHLGSQYWVLFFLENTDTTRALSRRPASPCTLFLISSSGPPSASQVDDNAIVRRLLPAARPPADHLSTRPSAAGGGIPRRTGASAYR